MQGKVASAYAERLIGLFFTLVLQCPLLYPLTLRADFQEVGVVLWEKETEDPHCMTVLHSCHLRSKLLNGQAFKHESLLAVRTRPE